MLRAVWLVGAGVPCFCNDVQAPLYVEAFKPYPGYTGSLSGVVGTVQLGQDGAHAQTLFFDFAKADPKCDNPTNVVGVTNACGIHIHEGTSCEDAGDHYWSSNFTADDPWATIRYTVPSSGANMTGGQNARVVTGTSLSDMVGRAVVVHDSAGSRIACGLLNRSAFTSGKQLTVSSFTKYPVYEGDLVVAGVVSIDLIGTGVEASQVLTFNLTGVDPTCGATDISGVANACGIHVHVGGACGSANTIGGHYYNQEAIASDPWKPITYTAPSGEASGITVKVVTGVTSEDVAGRTMIVHDASGARIACGAIPDPWSQSVIDSASSVTFAFLPLLFALGMALLC